MDKVRLVKMSEHDAWIEEKEFFEGKVFEVVSYYEESYTDKPNVPHWVRLNDVEIPKRISEENEHWDEPKNEFVFVSIEDNFEAVQ